MKMILILQLLDSKFKELQKYFLKENKMLCRKRQLKT